MWYDYLSINNKKYIIWGEKMKTDTIAAISTAVGEAAIGIVRLSGPESLDIISKLFKGTNLKDVPSHTINYGHIMNPETDEIIDEVMVSVLIAPKTFTKEDIIEINCHGGIVAVNHVLNIVLKNGARLAEPGEFTKRAFLNGRIDLSQAEAVMDLIQAQTDKAMGVAMSQLDGKLSGLIQSLRQKLIETIAQVEVTIDYPEYDDVEELSHKMMQDKTKEVHKEIDHLLSVASQGKILREGIHTAIIGRPNVGKSSLMNALVQEEKAIVTNIPGTTRDMIEEHVNVRGIPLKLVDTAGIRDTEDQVEKIGVGRSRAILQTADLVLVMLNNNEELTDEDKTIIESVKDLEYMVLINKVDLETKIDLNEVKNLIPENNMIEMSLTENQGIDVLEQKLVDRFFEGELASKDMTYVSNARHIDLLEQSKSALEDAMEGIELGVPMDMVQIDVTRTWEYLGEIIGDTASEGLIDQLFSQFCLGK